MRVFSHPRMRWSHGVHLLMVEQFSYFCFMFVFSQKNEDLWSPTIVKNNLSVTWAYVCMTLILCDHGALEFLELGVFGFW